MVISDIASVLETEERYLAYPLVGFVFQTLMVESKEHETALQPSVVTTTALTAAEWPLIVCRQ